MQYAFEVIPVWLRYLNRSSQPPKAPQWRWRLWWPHAERFPQHCMRRQFTWVSLPCGLFASLIYFRYFGITKNNKRLSLRLIILADTIPPVYLIGQPDIISFPWHYKTTAMNFCLIITVEYWFDVSIRCRPPKNFRLFPFTRWSIIILMSRCLLIITARSHTPLRNISNKIIFP